MTPVVALHGFTQTGAMFAEFAAESGVAVTAPDLPGHGAAAEVPARVAEALRIVARTVAEARPPVVLLGYSMGGRVALHAALGAPATVTALVLVSTTAGIADPAERAARRAADEALAARIEAGGVEEFLDGWLARPMFAGLARRGPAWQAADRRLRSANTAAGLAAALRGLGQGAMPDLSRRLRELAMPVLVVAGGDDPAYCRHATTMAAAMLDARVAVMPGVGHAVVGEDPAGLADLVRSFVSR